MSIAEVAKLAGVSTSTVSRVINRDPRVARQTVGVVREAMERLQYAPSDRRPGPKPGARAAAARSASVALLVLGSSRDRATPAFDDLIRGVASGATAWELTLTYHHVFDLDRLPAQVLNAQVDGLLLHGALPPPATRERLQKFPCVWLMGNRSRPDWGDQVMPDAYEIGDKAARYLMGRGHRRLAFLNLDRNHWPFRVSGRSFLAAAQDAGADCELITDARAPDEDYWPDFAIGAAEQLVQRFLHLDPRPTGLYVADDMQVAVLQPALQRAGVAIGPGQTEIISCNNEQTYLVGLFPKPAEIDVRVETVGYRGIERLLWRINHAGQSDRTVSAVEPAVIDHNGVRVHLHDPACDAAV
jgi:LacI family transcriptional regulator